MLEIALSRNWSNCALLLIDLSKAIEKRMWPYDHPLEQITTLQRDTIYNLRRWADDAEIADLREMDPKDVGDMVHMNETHGAALRNAALMFPTIGVNYALRPLAHDLLQITVMVEAQFQWNTKLSGSAEPFYVWVQDEEGVHILQWRSILLRQTSTTMDIDFVIPWDGQHSTISIVTASDRWLGSDSQTVISLANLIMPKQFTEATPLLDLPFLPITALDDPALVSAYRPHVPMLNSIQSQAFWSVYHTNNNVLLSAPVACGKSLLGEMAIWHAFRHEANGLALVIMPDVRSAGEAAARIRGIVPKGRKVSVTHMRNADALEKAAEAEGQRIIVATPQALDGIVGPRLYDLGHKLSLIVLEDLHLMDAHYELVIAKLLSISRAARTRIVGLSSTLINPTDLGNWLGVTPDFQFAFSPRDRGAPVVVQLKTFSTAHSATLLKTMVKPTYDIIKQAPGPVVVFTPSRVAARSAAADLVTQSGTEMDLSGFLQAPRADVEPLVARLRDSNLLEPLLHGIGYILPTMAPTDLALVLELFASGIIKALIAPRDACWTLPVRASTVVLMGAQYAKYDRASGDRVIANYARHELIRMQGFAVQSAHPAAQAGRMFVMCQGEQSVGIARVLSDGLPLESKLPAVCHREPGTESTAAALEGMLKPRDPPPPPAPHRPRVPDLRKRDLVDLMGWTLLGRRVRTNPTYYGLIDTLQAEGVSRLADEFYSRKDAQLAEERRLEAKARREKEKAEERERERKAVEEARLNSGALDDSGVAEDGDADMGEGDEDPERGVGAADTFKIEEVDVLDSDSD